MSKWNHLALRPHSFSKELFVKGTRIKASVIYSDMVANGMTAEEVAEDFDLPIKVVEECIQYCENKD